MHRRGGAAPATSHGLTDLELGFWGSGDDDHPFADVWAFRWGNLSFKEGTVLLLSASPSPFSRLGGRHTHQPEISGLPPRFGLTPASTLGHRSPWVFGCPGRVGSRPAVKALFLPRATSEPGLLLPRESKL